MKLFAIIIFSILVFTSKAQVITYDDFKEVIPFLTQEDYKGAFEKTKQLLSTTINDSSDLRGIVTYMNIYSAAGMVAKDQLTHAEFLKNAKQYIGQRVVMSAHPCIDSAAKGMNSLKFITVEGKQQGMTITANKTGTNILCFEYFDYTQNINPSVLIGKTVRCGGILKSVEVNPNGSKLWISRLYIANAFAREMTPN